MMIRMSTANWTAQTGLASSPETRNVREIVASHNDSDRRWSVLHVKARQEKVVADVLEEVGVPHFVPLTKQVRFYGHRRRTTYAVLFPSYVFIRGTVEETHLAISTKRVARVIPVFDQEQIDRDIRYIRDVLHMEGSLEACPYLQNGTRVRVVSGPFKGVEGLVEERLKCDRLTLQVQTLGRAASLEIDASLLERVD